MSKDNKSEKEKLKEIERLYEIEDQQSEILKKQTGKGLYERVKTTEDGKIIIDSDDKKQRKIWDIDE